MADTNILREYLVALGFTTDEKSQKKTEGVMDSVTKRTFQMGKAVMGVSAAVQAMVTVYAYQMEKLYYASKRTDSSVASIKALEFGSQQIGLRAGTMTGALEGMTRALRGNPGLSGLLDSLGVEVKGRDKSDVLMDLVNQLSKMPHYVGQQYAAMFGIDPDTLFMLKEGMGEMKKAQELRKQMSKEAGVDSAAAAEAAKEYANSLREVWERVGVLKDALSVLLLPAFKEFASVVNLVLGDLTKLVTVSKTFEDLAARFWEGIGAKQTGGGVKLSAESNARLGQGPQQEPRAPTWLGRILQDARRAGPGWSGPAKSTGPSIDPMYSTPGAGQNAPGAPKASAGGKDNPAALFARLEAQYALPKGWLDRTWKTESNRGDPKYMRSKVGAQGHFQFMPGTAKQYGLKDPNDLAQSAQAAARFFADLFKKYKGDAAKAAAAYNWGPGNVDKYGLGRAPKETRDYIGKVAGPEINQTNNYNISGVRDPEEAASRVSAKQEVLNADLIRNTRARVM